MYTLKLSINCRLQTVYIMGMKASIAMIYTFKYSDQSGLGTKILQSLLTLNEKVLFKIIAACLNV